MDLPFGLVAIFWVRMYLPLVAARMPQAPRNAGPADLGFPRAALDILVARGLTTPEALLPTKARGGMARLLGQLATVGQGDASVGRLLEGHANALELIEQTAPTPLRKHVFVAVEGRSSGSGARIRWKNGCG